MLEQEDAIIAPRFENNATKRKIFKQLVDYVKNARPSSTVEEEYTERSFDIAGELAKRKGVAIEIGGPTYFGGYSRISQTIEDFINNRKKIYVSNIESGLPIYDDMNTDNEEPLGHLGKVDFIADATKLPFAQESLGAVFASCLPAEIREESIKEAARTLEKGGLMIIMSGDISDMDNAKEHGFTVKLFKRYSSDDYDMILQKT